MRSEATTVACDTTNAGVYIVYSGRHAGTCTLHNVAYISIVLEECEYSKVCDATYIYTLQMA